MTSFDEGSMLTYIGRAAGDVGKVRLKFRNALHFVFASFRVSVSHSDNVEQS